MNILIVFIVFLIKYLILSDCLNCQIEPKNIETRLRHKILCSYDRDICPVINSKDVINVEIRLVVEDFYYEQKTKTLELYTFTRIRWHDPQLTWDSNEFDNIEELTVDSKQIWLPDLTVHHTLKTQFSDICEKTYLHVRKDGRIHYIPPCSFSGLCNDDYINWPFDYVTCQISIGVWSLSDQNKINLTTDQIDVEAISNREWRLIAINITNLREHDECCTDDVKPSFMVFFTIQRHSSSEMAFIAGAILIFIIMNLIVLKLHPHCCERITLNSLSLLVHFLYMQQISNLIPKNAENTPKILIFFRNSTIISTILLLETILLRGQLVHKLIPKKWSLFIINVFEKTTVGKFLFTSSYFMDKEVFTQTEDCFTLEEDQSTQTEVNGTLLSNENSKYQVIMIRFIDSIIFLLILTTYIILCIWWFPRSKNIKGNIIGGTVPIS